MKDVYKDITEIIDRISELPVFPSLVWVWTWDVTRSMIENFRSDPDYSVMMDDEEIWELFWRDVDKNAFTLEYGVETLDEQISDWLFEIEAVEDYEELEDEDE
jgi:argonaute-like protein implicated in RNA metabolism and viral defense